MATATLTTAEEYLAASYRPDRELLDGQLVERNVGEYDHSNLQSRLTIWFGIRERQWGIRALTEQRIRVAPHRFRIPDVCVIRRDQPVEPVFTRPPLICIEVLSREDTLRGLQERVTDYLTFGVPNVWVLDPSTRKAWVCDRSGFHEPQDEVLAAAGTEIAVPLRELFAELD